MGNHFARIERIEKIISPPIGDIRRLTDDQIFERMIDILSEGFGNNQQDQPTRQELEKLANELLAMKIEDVKAWLEIT